MLFRPKPFHAIGNLSLSLATHFINSGGVGRFHKDVYLYGRDQMFVFKHVSDEENGKLEDMSYINAFVHLKHENLGEVMRYLIQPSPRMQSRVDKAWEKISHCVACFHIRRGTYSEDSSSFAVFPSASDKAVDAMVAKALEMDQPVFVLSDSVSTKEDFLRRVPKAVALDHAIGFTACEHSQNAGEVEDEAFEAKMNSVMEWFLISKFSTVYTTMGGVGGIHVPEGTPEGVSSTFGFSATIYGGHLPHYVYNDGTFFYPDSGKKGWADINTGNYIVIRNPTKEKIEWCKKNYGMWKVLVEPKECEAAGIKEWCTERFHVQMRDEGKIAVRKLKQLDFTIKDVCRN